MYSVKLCWKPLSPKSTDGGEKTGIEMCVSLAFKEIKLSIDLVQEWVVVRSIQNSLKIWRASIPLGHRAMSEGHEIEAQKSLKALLQFSACLATTYLTRNTAVNCSWGWGREILTLEAFSLLDTLIWQSLLLLKCYWRFLRLVFTSY